MRFPIFAFAILSLSCTKPDVVETPPTRDLSMSPQVLETVVRIDVGGHFTGSGVVVTPQGHVVTATRAIIGHEDLVITVGDDRIKADIVAVDRPHNIVLLRAERPLPRSAMFEIAPGPAKDSPARVVGYADTQSEPPMIERRNGSARIDDPHFRGESADDHDFGDLLIARCANDMDRLRLEGSGVFSTKNGLFVGIVIGKIGLGTSTLIAIPSTTIIALLSSRNIEVPTPY